MNNFLLVFTGGSMAETEEEQKLVMKAWAKWYEELGDHLVDEGNPTGPVAKTIHSDGMVHDGSEGLMITGYSMLKAESLDQAVDLAKGCPVLEGDSSITVHEIFPVM